MPVEWVVSPHEPALEQIDAGVRDGTGVVLIGPAGVGKTTLARAASHRLGATCWVTATASAAAVPFAAFAHLVTIPESGKTAAVLRAAREALADQLLVVDDAHLLDRMSATLVYQLALGGTVRLIVTVAAGAPAPEVITALWHDGLLARIDVEPPGHEDARVTAQVAAHIADLPADARRALEVLAVEDPLPLADLEAVAGAEAVAAARRLEVITVDDDMAHAAHPLFLDAMRAALGGPDLRRLRTELAAAPARCAGVVDRLRVAVRALDSDHEQPVQEVAAAAEEALRLGDLELSERLGRAAMARSGGLRAQLALAYALAWQGRGREADAVLAAVDVSGLAEDELLAWALPRAANQFWMLSEPERATAFLHTMCAKVSTPRAQTTLDALSATFAMNAGSPSRAMQIAGQVLASPAADDTAVGWAAAAAALSCARMGRFSDVDALADRALAAHHPGLLRFTSGYGQTTALMMAGELDRAHGLARRLTDYAELQQPGRAIGEVLIADVLIARGDLSAAVELLRDATAALAPTGYSWGPLAWMLLAQALGQQGATVEAGKALVRAESRHGLKSMLFAPELALARAATMAARRDSHGAIAAARDAVRSAERGGQFAVALRASHEAVRLGDARAVDALTRVDVDCVYARLVTAHARALAAHDAAALDEVAAGLAGIGMHGAAADAARQANLAK